MKTSSSSSLLTSEELATPRKLLRPREAEAASKDKCPKNQAHIHDMQMLQSAKNMLSSVLQNLRGEDADVNSNPQVKAPLDPTVELYKLISEHKYEEAFTDALERRDATVVSWLCGQVDLQKLLLTTPMPLSQGVLVSLVHQLACNIYTDKPRKLVWITDVLVAIDIPKPNEDPMFGIRAVPILEQVSCILSHLRPKVCEAEVRRIQLIKEAINHIQSSYRMSLAFLK